LGTIPAHNDAQKIAKRIQKWETAYFLFIDTGIAPTNNAGEQTIRQVVLDRKVTQGSRSEWGDAWHERFWNILTTCSLQKIPVMSFIKACITAYTFDGNYPLLLSNKA
jgi:transposase